MRDILVVGGAGFSGPAPVGDLLEVRALVAVQACPLFGDDTNSVDKVDRRAAERKGPRPKDVAPLR